MPHSKARAREAQKLASELDQLNEKLAEVRAETARIAASRAATERKLEHIGKNISGLQMQLSKVAVAKPRTRK
jgi:septal ring factor EnvC (AmiA/AmiB activator)